MMQPNFEEIFSRAIFQRSIREIVMPLLQVFCVTFATFSVISTLDAILQFGGSLFDLQDFGLVYVLKYLLFPFTWLLGLEDKALEVNICSTFSCLFTKYSFF